MTPSRRWDPCQVDPGEIPAYTTIEAAHHLRLPENTVRAWAFGRSFTVGSGRKSVTPPLIEAAAPGKCLLSFLNLMEIQALRGIRKDHDVQMDRIRRALEWLREHQPSKHPLIDNLMETDGVDLFLEHYGELINLSRSGQLAMKEVFQAHLRRIERDHRGIAVKFFPFTRPVSTPGRPPALSDDEQPRAVFIDPRIAFGRPCLTGSRIPTVEVFERFEAGDSIDEIATDYDCPSSAIEEALRWEKAAA